MIKINLNPLGLGNVFGNNKLLASEGLPEISVSGPCMGSPDAIVNENSCLCLTEEDNNGCPTMIPKSGGFDYAGVSYCEDSQIVRYYPKLVEQTMPDSPLT
jgi:hypothetical protein